MVLQRLKYPIFYCYLSYMQSFLSYIYHLLSSMLFLLPESFALSTAVFFQNYLRGSSCWCLISRLIYMSNLKNESQCGEYLIIDQNNHIGIEVNLFPWLSIEAKIIFLSFLLPHSVAAQLRLIHLFLSPNTIN